MFLNPSGMGGSSWNMSDPNKEGYSLELWGTIVSLQEVQARDYNPYGNQPGRPSFWPDGNPKMNIRVGFATPDGSLKTVTFAKAGKKQASGEKPSLHMQLFNLTNHNMMELMGKTLHLWTWPANPNTGVAWGKGNPRLFGVEEVEGTTYQLAGQLPPEFLVPELYANDGAQGGAPNPQMIQQPQVPPMQGNFYAPPMAQSMQQQYPYTQQQPTQYQPQPMPQQNMQPMGMQPPMQQQPMPQQAAPAPQAMAPQGMGAPAPMPATQAMLPQPASAPMPQGMDPAVAAAMQAVGAVNVQEVDSTGGVYDDDIPFNNYR